MMHHHQTHINNSNSNNNNNNHELTNVTTAPLIRYPPSNNSLLSSGNTKKSIAYEPRTEAISPAINDDYINTEDSTSKSTKDEQTLLVEKLKKVEAEILQTDIQINRLRKQKALLEQAANSASKDDDDQENVCSDTKQLSIAKLVYHENRAKAQKAHAKLDCINGAYQTKDLPIYNQPSDNAIYHINAAKYNNSFKSKLIACFKEKLQSRSKLEEQVSSEYNRRMEKWLESIEREDSQPSKRAKDAKTREFFEKQFPELKKARESGERFSRVGQRVARSDAELDELLDGITEREDQDKKVKSYAVIPPMLEEMRARKPKYINRNGFVEDIIEEYKEYQILNTWTDEEKEIFRENYLQHPKNFGLIASMTSRKNVANCVQYYYMSKKSENYKQLLKRQQKRRTRSFVRPAQQTPVVTTASNNNTTSTSTNDESNNDANKANVVSSNGKQVVENASTNDNQNPTNNIKSSKSSAFLGIERETNMNSDAINTSSEDSQLSTTCCVCKSSFKDQYRNVTRSNYQLYGIRIEKLKPGLKICYDCRFRHVIHPSFDDLRMTPEPMDMIEEDINNDMKLDQPVISVDTQPTIDNCGGDIKPVISDLQHSCPQIGNMNENHPPNCENGNKAQQRTCVRDIIYQAIEMSFQKPKTSEVIDAPNHMKVEPVIQPEALQMNPIAAQHSISNIVPPPLKPVLTPNHIVPPQPPQQRLTIPQHMPPPPPIQNLAAVDYHQLQVLQSLHQKQQQLQQMEYNIRHQQFLSQQLHQQQQFQQQQHQQLQAHHHIQQQQQQLQRQQQQQHIQQQIQQQQPQSQQQPHHQQPQQPQQQQPPQPQPQPQQPQPQQLQLPFRPPMAHGGVRMMEPQHDVIENGVLNLSAKSAQPAPSRSPSPGSPTSPSEMVIDESVDSSPDT